MKTQILHLEVDIEPEGQSLVSISGGWREFTHNAYTPHALTDDRNGDLSSLSLSLSLSLLSRALLYMTRAQEMLFLLISSVNNSHQEMLFLLISSVPSESPHQDESPSSVPGTYSKWKWDHYGTRPAVEDQFRHSTRTAGFRSHSSSEVAPRCVHAIKFPRVSARAVSIESTEGNKRWGRGVSVHSPSDLVTAGYNS
uniref:Uncharacterized protein n=1 Tax=Timema bartmani TaxID=61472 RepID=A0A7R9HZX3_9NEOP|nr:unnamed protein product [Timema bartmani]